MLKMQPVIGKIRPMKIGQPSGIRNLMELRRNSRCICIGSYGRLGRSRRILGLAAIGGKAKSSGQEPGNMSMG